MTWLFSCIRACDPEKESSAIELRVEKLSGEREGETQPLKVVKSRKNEDQTKKKSQTSKIQATKTHKSWQLPLKLKRKKMIILKQRNQYL